MSFRLYALSLSVFAIGVAEFVLVGLLPSVAEDVGVPVGRAGLLVTAYALAIAVGSPLLIAMLSRFNARSALIGLMAAFTIGNLVVAVAPTFTGLIAGRVVSGAAHGAVVAIGASVAASLVPKEREGRAVANVLLGLTAAMVLGVPIGNALGSAFGWRGTFAALAGLGLIATATLVALPSTPASDHVLRLRTQLSALRLRPLLLSYAVTSLAFGSSFAVFPYLEPLLHDHAGFDATAITWLLALFGASTVLGNLVGGRLADRVGTLRTTAGALAGVLIVLASLTVTANNRVAVVINLVAWGFVAFMIAPAVQTAVMRIAESHDPGLAKVAGGLNVSAFNVGIAAASFAGGLALESEGVRLTPWVGVAFALAAVIPLGLLASQRVQQGVSVVPVSAEQ
jgi:predicted MFS family arabinose efflux permease